MVGPKIKLDKTNNITIETPDIVKFFETLIFFDINSINFNLENNKSNDMIMNVKKAIPVDIDFKNPEREYIAVNIGIAKEKKIHEK